ncbi:LysM peptidoglycan-binding domain-containing protein [Kitasatospora sp. NPDC085879]|uniref:LysM peptidoglycan-binding domain-containing protein n=1 Tax=Kitasatospora sp. NPDC085879 TaxID=3154769 RepID=UPI00342474E5
MEPGDTLWAIAEKLRGVALEWKTIFAANVAKLEEVARAHGFASSDDGHWIFPETVLVIP